MQGVLAACTTLSDELIAPRGRLLLACAPALVRQRDGRELWGERTKDIDAAQAAAPIAALTSAMTLEGDLLGAGRDGFRWAHLRRSLDGETSRFGCRRRDGIVRLSNMQPGEKIVLLRPGLSPASDGPSRTMWPNERGTAAASGRCGSRGRAHAPPLCSPVARAAFRGDSVGRR